MTVQVEHPLIGPGMVRLGATPSDKSAAIQEVGGLLVAAGCVAPTYVSSMMGREAVGTTFLGSGVAIPHGLGEDRELILQDGVAVLQTPRGIAWGDGQSARLVIGIAANSTAHLAILRNLSRLMQDEARLAELCTTTDPQAIRAALAGEEARGSAAATANDLAQVRAWTVDYPSGLHARPATQWVKAAQALGVPVQVRRGGEVADARDLLALLRLGLRPGETVTLSAEGPGALAALDQFHAVIAGLAAQEATPVRSPRLRLAGRAWTPPGAAEAIVGVGAGPGLRIGHIRLQSARHHAVPDRVVPLGDGARLFRDALDKTREQLDALAVDVTRRASAADGAIFRAQMALLDDVDLIAATCRRMAAGHGAAWAWSEAIEQLAGQLSAQSSTVVAARAADLRDVGGRVLLNLEPALADKQPDDLLADEPCIVVATDLSPSETATLDITRVAGLVTAHGGPTSHTAILARTLGLPAVVAAGPAVLKARAGALAIIDGDGGRLYVDPTPECLRSAQAWITASARQDAREAEERDLPAQLLDGVRVSIQANVDRPGQIEAAIAGGAEGVGLMRTEFLFLERGRTPTEDEQYEIYRDMADALSGRPLVVRALDIGGDKQAEHLGLPHEANPFLGVRGARLLLRRPDLLEPQLRALYRVARSGGALSIMFPMISSIGEVAALKDYCERVRIALDAPPLPVGLMIEVPAAAIVAEALAGLVDFFSIGTNDLTQYALAIDRQNPELAAEADSLHPAVLRLVAMTVAGAARHGRKVSVCGGAAGDPFGAGIFAGLGVTELSMTPRDIPAVKARLRQTSLAALQDLAARALTASSAAEVRALGGTLA